MGKTPHVQLVCKRCGKNSSFPGKLASLHRRKIKLCKNCREYYKSKNTTL